MFIKSINKNYIADACLMKLYEYYYASTYDKEDLKILNLIADLYIKVNSTDKNKYNKGLIIQNLEKKKKQISLDLHKVKE